MRKRTMDSGWTFPGLTGLACLLVGAGGMAGAWTPSIAFAGETGGTRRLSTFHIPAQSLDRALLRYSAATGVQILYKAGLVAGKRSSAVNGRFAPSQALEQLLRGTGLRIRYSAPGAITLAAVETGPSREVMALDLMQVNAAPLSIGGTREYNPYGERLRSGIIAALRRHPVASRGRYEVTVRVWLDSAGTVSRAELAASTGEAARDQAILQAIGEMAALEAPPAGLPQPVAFQFRAQAVK